MSVDVERTITLNRPKADVAAYVTDPANDTSWLTGIKDVELLAPPPIETGSRVRRVAKFLGRSIDYVLEIVEHDPESVVVMKSVRGPFPMVVTYRFADAEAGTKMSIRVQATQAGSTVWRRRCSRAERVATWAAISSGSSAFWNPEPSAIPGRGCSSHGLTPGRTNRRSAWPRAPQPAPADRRE